MFLGFSFGEASALQQMVLVLNTILLVGILVAAELVYAGRSRAQRRQLRLFYPIIIVLGGMVLVAMYTQAGA